VSRLSGVPPVRFARGLDGAVAYQVWGEGPIDLLVLTEYTTSVDSLWEHPGRTRFLMFKGSLGRVICFDPRGQGASDPLPLDQLGSTDAWVEDALHVLDDLEVETVVVSAESFSSHAAITLALRHPERVSRLALLNPFARLTRDGDHPFGRPPEDVPVIVSTVRDRWGLGELVASVSPSLREGAPDSGFLARAERLGASPSVAAALTEVAWTADIRPLLPRLEVPVLVVHTGDLRYVTLDHSRYVAEHIPGAVMVEAPSRSFYWGESGLGTYAEFLSGAPAEPTDHAIASVLFTDIVESTEATTTVGNRRWSEVLDHLDGFVALQVDRFGGRLVKQTGDGHLAVFSQPAAGIRAAQAVLEAAPTLGVRLRAGLHTGDVQQRPDGDVTGLAVNIASRVAGAADALELLVSRTVADLVAGSEFHLVDRGEHDLKGIRGPWQLYAVDTG
jgi:class 3 adenylate cyclase/pimeloyl-ACP methyl ester carboxylesterase